MPLTRSVTVSRDAVVTGAGVALATFVQQLYELGGEPASQPVQLSDPTVLVLLRDNLADSDTNSYSNSAFPALSSAFPGFLKFNEVKAEKWSYNDFSSVILVEKIQYSNITIIMIGQTTTQIHSYSFSAFLSLGKNATRQKQKTIIWLNDFISVVLVENNSI